MSATVKYVYVAGPYSGDVMANIRKAMQIAATLLDRGFIPFVPHVTGFWDLVSPRDYDRWLDYDLAWVERCDALFRIEGTSPGADREVLHAERHGKPVFTALDDLLDACGHEASA